MCSYDYRTVPEVLKNDNLRTWDKTQGSHARQHFPTAGNFDNHAFLSGAQGAQRHSACLVRNGMTMVEKFP
jgi:hypothetical protein